LDVLLELWFSNFFAEINSEVPIRLINNQLCNVLLLLFIGIVSG